MKKILTLLLLVAVTGCGLLDREFAKLTGYSLICVEETGVMYVQFSSGAAPLVDINGKPRACKP